LQVAAQITFARVLGPEQFGVFLLAAVAIGLASLLADIGVSYALIQRPRVSDRDVRLALTWHVLAAAGVTSLVVAFAYRLGPWFGDERLAPVVETLALVLIINAAGVPALNLLKRELNFRAIHVSSFRSYLLGYVAVGIPAALLGAGVWAPVIAWLVQAGANSALLYFHHPHAVAPLLVSNGGRWFAGYSITFMATNLTNWCLMNVDRVVLGRTTRLDLVGLYATPYNLLTNPTVQILSTSQSILFSATSRLQDRLHEMRRAYLAVLAAVALFIAPVFVGAAVAAPTIVAVLYGPAWAAAADALRPLALAMPLYLVWGLSTPILWNTDQKHKEYRNQLPLVPLWGLVAWVSADVSIGALAWAVVGLQALRATVTTLPALSVLTIDLRSVLVVLRGGSLASLIVAASVAGADAVSRQVASTPAIWLSADIAAGALMIVAALKYIPGVITPELAVLIDRTLRMLPLPLSRALSSAMLPRSQL
jgi:O-antigen/teichoic acid export membrane protein